jgi:hypothetical protein
MTEEKIRAWAGPIEIDYWNVDQDTYEDKVTALTTHTKEELVSAIIDYHYNSFCSHHADNKDEGGQALPGKRIPYMGWFWRGIRFSNDIPIGRGMSPDNSGRPFIGFMANNKWDYPERYLTEVERLRVLAYLDKAIASYRRDKDAMGLALQELWDYMQTLTID